MQAPVALNLRTADVQKVFASPQWKDAASLRALIGEGKQTGYFTTETLACLVTDASAAFSGAAKAVERALVILNQTTLITFDVVAGGPKASWALEGNTDGLWRKSIPFSNGTSDQVFLNVIAAREVANIIDISAVDLAGVQIGEYAVLFYVDVRAGRSAVFFDAPKGDKLRILIAGMAPGIWEIWRNGWLDEPKCLVTPQANCLYYEGRPGGYFFRRTQ